MKKPHLLLFRFSALGDVAMTIPVIRCLYKSHPDLKITLVSRPYFEPLFEEFCFALASFESSRHIYRREHGPGQVRRLFNTKFTAFELRRYMMNFYFSKGSFTISELVEASDFSRPTVNSTVHDALKLGYLEELSGSKDRRRHDYRPTKPMLDAWRNYCNALLVNPKFSHALKLAQTLISMRDLEVQFSKKNM